MAALGLAVGVELSQRRAAAGLSLMPAGTTLLVAGDSLSRQAVSGSAHPFCWASRKGSFDIDYNHRLHNIGVGGTGANGSAAIVGGTRSGLVHPERLARDTGYVASSGAKVLLLDVGTNSAPGDGASSFANVQSYVNAMRGAGIERVILGTLQPRMSDTSTPTVYMTASQAQNCRTYNELMIAWAASDPAVYVYDGSAGELDPARSAEFGPIGGGSNSILGSSTYDGVHWGEAHGLRREDELVAVLQHIFPVRPERAYSTAAEYSWSANRYKNILAATAGFSGAGGRNPSSGGPTGSFGNGWICSSGAALPAGVTVVGWQVTVQYSGAARNAIRIAVSGTPAADFGFTLQKSASVPIGTDADNKLRMDGSEKLLHEWVIEFEDLTGCDGFECDLSIGGPGAVSARGSGAAQFLGPIDGRYVWREPSAAPVTAANTSCTPKMKFYFKAGQPISGAITFIHAFLGHVA